MTGPNKSHPRISYFAPTPIAQSIKSKFVADKNAGRVTTIDGVATPHPNTLSQLGRSTMQSVYDAENIFATQPDVEIAMSVLVSAIMSPIELRDANLTWTSEDPSIPSDLNNALLEYLRAYFEDEYKLKSLIEPMLKDCLFHTGSYPLLVIPESSVDDIIHGRDGISKSALESFKQYTFNEDGITRPLGILGNNNEDMAKSAGSYKSALESRFNLTGNSVNVKTSVDNFIDITDNPDCLKIPYVMRRIATEKINNTRLRSRSLESVAAAAKTNVDDVVKALKVQRNYSTRIIQRVKPMAAASRPSIGHPLVMNLSSVSTIPVGLAADPQNPLGFFILTDPLTGHEITERSARDFTGAIDNFGQMTDANSRMLQRTGFLSAGMTNARGHNITDDLIMAYSKEFEREISERFINGAYGQAVTFPKVTEFYRIMLSRTLANQHTQILYVPAELMTYFAFDYNELGIGRSMLDKMKVLANVRSVLLFGNVMGALKNSVPHRNVMITLDENDPEPEKTVEMMLNEYAKVQSSALTTDITAPKDQIDAIRRAATSVLVTGNPAYPDVTMSVEDTNSSRASVDTDLMDKVDTRFFQGFSLTPELVDATANIEFASVALNSSLLFTKRVAMVQEIASPLLCDHVVKYTLNSGTLLTGMIRLIQEYETKVKQAKDDSDSEANLKDIEQSSISTMDPAPADPVDPTAPEAPATEEPAEPTIEPIDLSEPYSVRESDITGTTAAKAKEEGLAQTNSKLANDWMETINDFLGGLKISLPAPDSTKLTNQIEQFNNYAQALDAVLPIYLNEEILNQIIGPDNQDKVASVMEIVKGYFLRDFAARNNIMPELNDLVRKMVNDEKPFDLLEEHTQHIDGITQTLASLIDKLKEKNDASGGEEDTDLGGGGADTSTTDDTGSDEFGADDFGGDFEDFETTEDTLEEDKPEEPETKEDDTQEEPEEPAAEEPKAAEEPPEEEDAEVPPEQ